jgi:HEAT repeat protein
VETVVAKSLRNTLVLWLVAQAVPLVAACAANGNQELPEQRFQAYVSQLVGELSAPDATTRRQAAARLGEIGPDATRAVKPLAGALEDTDLEVRRAAALALFRMAKESKPIVPALLKAVNDKDPNVRANVLLALGGSGDKSPAVREAVAAALADPAKRVRETAREVLETLR